MENFGAGEWAAVVGVVLFVALVAWRVNAARKSSGGTFGGGGTGTGRSTRQK